MESRIASPIVLTRGAGLTLDFLSVDRAESMLHPYQALAGLRKCLGIPVTAHRPQRLCLPRSRYQRCPAHR